MEVKNKLLNFKNKIIYQDDEWFNFSLDSVLLANFVTINAKDKKILDIGTGNAPIPMLLTYRTQSMIEAVELQESIYHLAKKSVEENKLSNQIKIYNMDIKNFINKNKEECYDIITCNPPYFKLSKDSNLNVNEIKAIARHEIKLTLEDIVLISSKLLKKGGKLALVFRTERFMELVDNLKKYHIEIKKIQFVYPKDDKNSNIVLVEGVKLGGKGLKILPPLYVHNEDGTYKREIVKMFGDDDR